MCEEAHQYRACYIIGAEKNLLNEETNECNADNTYRKLKSVGSDYILEVSKDLN
jgi:hypothetical protein